MSLSGLLDAVLSDPGLSAVLAAARSGPVAALDVVAVSARPLVVAGLAARRPRGAGRPVLLVTATGRESEDLATALRCFLPPDRVAEFPAWETLPHERLSPRSDTVGRRLGVLRRLAHPREDDPVAGPIDVLVAPIRAVMQPIVAGLGDLQPVGLTAGHQIGLEDVVERLTGAAYTRVDMVERRGEFAVRGGILDVFPPTEDHPLRVEFWGDTVEEVRWFAVADQRSLEVAPRGLWAPPCREVLLTDAVRDRAAALVDQLPGVADLLEKVAAGIAVEGMESLAPVLVERMVPLLDLLPEGAVVVLADPEKVRTRAHDLVATSAEFLAASWANASAGNAVPVDLSGWVPGESRVGAAGELSQSDLGEGSYWPLSRVREHARDRRIPWWTLTSLTRDAELVDTLDVACGDEAEVVRVGLREVAGYRGETEKALADLRTMVSSGWTVVATTEGLGPAKRLVEVLAGADVPARLVGSVDDVPPSSVVQVTTAGVEHGFVADDLRVALLTEADLVSSVRPPGHRAGCRAAVATSSIRCSSRRATSSSTSSTGSAATSR
jgi:transcription-repair coupling factor (superfamily II helicase)